MFDFKYKSTAHTLPIPFSNSNYVALITSGNNGSSNAGWDYVYDKTETSFKAQVGGNTLLPNSYYLTGY